MQNKRSGSFWLKGLGLFLMVMFLFTIISKAADSFTVAKVEANSPSARKLQYTVQAEGRVEKNREISVITQPDILIKSVLVSAGQRVEKGDILSILDQKNLQERLESVQGEKRALELQNQAAKENAAQEIQKQNKALKRAKSDYSLVKAKNSKAILKLQKSLEKSESALKKAQSNYNKIQKSGNKTQIDKAQERINACRADVKEKQNAVSELKNTAETEEKTAQRAIEDATLAPAADNTIEINNISIHNLNMQISKLTALQKQKGQITAPASGVITEIMTNVGQKTLETAMFTMTDEKAGLKFAGQIPIQDAKHISVGDVVSLKSTGNETEAAVTSLDMDESKEFMNITALLPADSFSLGESVTMNMVQESKDYPCTVPLSAIYKDNGKYFVFILQTENTILGKQQITRKTEVKVLEQNDSYAALESEGLKENCKIITNSDRILKTGDRVRLKKEE